VRLRLQSACTCRNRGNKRSGDLAQAEEIGCEFLFRQETKDAFLNFARAGIAEWQGSENDGPSAGLLRAKFLKTTRFEIVQLGKAVIDELQIGVIHKEDNPCHICLRLIGGKTGNGIGQPFSRRSGAALAPLADLRFIQAGRRSGRGLTAGVLAAVASGSKERVGLRPFVERLGRQIDAAGPDDGPGLRIDRDTGEVGRVVQRR